MSSCTIWVFGGSPVGPQLMRHLDVVVEFACAIFINFHLDQTNFPVNVFSPGAPNYVNSVSLVPHSYMAHTWGSDLLQIILFLPKSLDRWPVSFLCLWDMGRDFLFHVSLLGQPLVTPAKAYGFPSCPLQCTPSSNNPCFWKTPGLFGFSSYWLLWFCIPVTVLAPKILNFISF